MFQPEEVIKDKTIFGVKSLCGVFIYFCPKSCNVWRMKSEFSTKLIPHPGPLTYSRCSAGYAGICNIQSKTFFMIVAKKATFWQRYNLNLFTNQDVGDLGVAGQITKLFLLVVENGHTHYILEMYLILPPLNNRIFLEALQSRSIIHILARAWDRFYFVVILRRINALYDIANIEFNVAYYSLRHASVWTVLCLNCVDNDGSALSNLENMYVRFWHGKPELEALYITLLYPNSTLTFDQIISPFTSRLTIQDSRRPFLYASYKRTRGFYFLTCADIVEVGALSLLGYVSAFDLPTWICFFMMSFLTAMFLVRVMPKGFFEYLLMCLVVLLEQDYISTIPRKLRSITGVWLIAGIILSTLYVGDNITALTAPLPTFKLETFDQLIARNFYYFMAAPVHLHSQFIKLFDDVKGMSNKTNLTFDAARRLTGFDAHNFREKYTFLFRSRFFTLKKASVKKINTIANNVHIPTNHTHVKLYGHSGTFLPQLAKCKKDAFIGHLEEVHEIYHALSRLLRNKGNKGVVTMGKESLSEGSMVWNVYNAPSTSSQFFIKYHSLWHSGMVEFWDNWKIRLATWKSHAIKAHEEHESRKPKSLSLTGNVVVVFYFYRFFIIMSAFWFLREIINLICKVVRNVYVKCKNIRNSIILRFRKCRLSMSTWDGTDLKW